MPIQGYRQSTSRKVFTNFPFKNGMVFENTTLNERQLKTSINFDISNSGDYGYPRGAFVNALLHNGHNTVKMPNVPIKQETNLGKTFLISSDYMVNTESFKDSRIGDDVETITPLVTPFGLHINLLQDDLSSFENAYGLVPARVVGVVDGDTIDVEIADGLLRRVRLLCVDTPELPTFSSDYIHCTADNTLYQISTQSVLYTGVGSGVYFFDSSGDLYQWVLIDELPTQVFVSSNYADRHTATSVAETVAILTSVKAKQHLQTILPTNTDIILEYDAMSFKENVIDGYPRLLTYVHKDEGENGYRCINIELVALGLAKVHYTSGAYRYYSNVAYAQMHAISVGKGVWGSPLDYATVVPPTVSQYLGSLNEEVLYEDSDEHFVKKCVTLTDVISPVIYDTVSYYLPTKTATTLFDSTTGDIYIEMLVNQHQKEYHEYIAKTKDVPHADNNWRNSITFIGRVIRNGKVVYKGIIILQYDGIRHNVLIVKAKDIHIGTYSTKDPTSVTFNGFDESPYVYQDLITPMPEAGYFAYPVILSALVYDREPVGADAPKAKVLKGFNTQQRCFVKPYIAIPTFSTIGLKGTYIRYVMSPTQKPDEGWVQIINSSGVYDTSAIPNMSKNSGVLKTFDMTQTGGRPITVEMETRYESLTATNTNANFSVVADTDAPYKESFVKDYEVTYSIKMQEFKTLSQLGIDAIVGGGDGVVPVLYTFKNKTDNITQSYTIDTLVINEGTTQTPIYVLTIGCQFMSDGLKFTRYETGVSLYTMPSTVTTKVTTTYNIYKSVANTQMVFLTGTAYVDQEEMLKTFNIWNATDIAQFDRYLILYGPYMGAHALQFLEYDDFGLAPFPYGQIMFDSPIRHVHPHRGSLYVFCDDGIWLLHSGLTYLDMRKTFAYAGISLDPTEKNSVISVANNVFVLHHEKGYVIRTNQNVMDASDIYTVVLTGPVDSIIDSPRLFLKDRLQHGYGLIVNDTSVLTGSFSAYNYSNELHLTASYTVEGQDIPYMAIFIYDVDTKRWRMYDTVAGNYPVVKDSDSSTKTYGFVLLNHSVHTFPTYAQFVHYLPSNKQGYRLGDVSAVEYDSDAGGWRLSGDGSPFANTVTPVMCFLDTGSLGFQTMYTKRIRRIYIDVVNIAGKELEFKLNPYVDSVPLHDEFEVVASVDEIGNVETELNVLTDVIVPRTHRIITPSLITLAGYSLTEDMLTTRRRVRVETHINAVGKLPGFTMLVPATDQFQITHYGMVFRTQSAR